MKVGNVIRMEGLVIAWTYSGGRTGVYTRYIRDHICLKISIKAHYKTIYEGNIVCIKDEIRIDGPLLLTHGVAPSAGLKCNFFLDHLRPFSLISFHLKPISFSTCMDTNIK